MNRWFFLRLVLGILVLAADLVFKSTMKVTDWVLTFIVKMESTMDAVDARYELRAVKHRTIPVRRAPSVTDVLDSMGQEFDTMQLGPDTISMRRRSVPPVGFGDVDHGLEDLPSSQWTHNPTVVDKLVKDMEADSIEPAYAGTD